jgi:hypothetical protein
MIWQKLMMAEAAPAGYSCTITIGDYFGVLYGYGTEDGNLGQNVGSIDAEPIPGETLVDCFWDPAGAATVVILGNVTGLVGSLNVWLGGVNYGGSGNWTYDGSFATSVTTGTSPSNTSGTILLEIK